MLEELENLSSKHSSEETINDLCERIEESLRHLNEFIPSNNQETRSQSIKVPQLRKRFEEIVEKLEKNEFDSKQTLFQELDNDLLLLRNQQTVKLEAKMKSAKELMDECSKITIEQGVVLDRIDAEMEETRNNSKQTTQELEKTKKKQSYRKTTCVIIVLLSLLLFIGVVVVAFVLGRT
jgi:membrane-associated HD superfamily phosphohydrolase